MTKILQEIGNNLVMLPVFSVPSINNCFGVEKVYVLAVIAMSRKSAVKYQHANYHSVIRASKLISKG